MLKSQASSLDFMVQKDKLSGLVRISSRSYPQRFCFIVLRLRNVVFCFVFHKHHQMILKQVVCGQYFEKYYPKPKG